MKRFPAVAAAALLISAACPGPDRGPVRTSAPTPRASLSTADRCADLDSLVRRVRRGHVSALSPDVDLIPREPNYIGTAAAPVHSGPWDYLARVPLLIYGPGHVRAAEHERAVTMADLAPTTAALIGSERFRAPDGRPLTESLRPGAPPPRLVVTIVWDGGGWNVLDRHRRSHPFFDSLAERSAVYPKMEIGSSPSVTPPIHATLSTGAFPRRHGIPGLRIRRAGEYVDPFLGLDPSNMKVPTLADVYDLETGNRAVTGMLASVNWHLSMIGQGAGRPQGDRDPVVLVDPAGGTFSNESLYSLPPIADPEALQELAEEMDAGDGSTDGEWHGHPIDDPEVRYASPAHVQYEAMLFKRLVRSEGFGRDDVPDLLYVNFKPLDDAGHAWGMTSKETALTLAATDTALRDVVNFLDAEVGRRRYVLFLTADHGQTPYPRESGGWPIGGGELARDANAALDDTDDGADVVDRVSSPGAYLNRPQLQANGLTVADVARWMASYTVEQNVKEKGSLPESFEGREAELLFDAALVHGRRVVSEACG